jgi:serine protease Do
MVNCPDNPQGRVTAGRINGPPALVNGYPLWQVAMKVVPGTSGSPVFDPDGRLVGVVRGRYRGTESRGFLIPVGTIREFLDQEKR